MLGSGGGELRGGNSLVARGGGRGGRLSVLCSLCCVFSLSVSLLLLFPLFAVLLNCPYPDPPVFCLFLFILLHTPARGGAAMLHFCFLPQLNQNTHIINNLSQVDLLFPKTFSSRLVPRLKVHSTVGMSVMMAKKRVD